MPLPPSNRSHDEPFCSLSDQSATRPTAVAGAGIREKGAFVRSWLARSLIEQLLRVTSLRQRNKHTRNRHIIARRSFEQNLTQSRDIHKTASVNASSVYLGFTTVPHPIVRPILISTFLLWFRQFLRRQCCNNMPPSSIGKPAHCCAARRLLLQTCLESGGKGKRGGSCDFSECYLFLRLHPRGGGWKHLLIGLGALLTAVCRPVSGTLSPCMSDGCSQTRCAW